MKKIVILFLLITNFAFSQEIMNFRLQRISPIIDMGTMEVMFDVGGLDYYGQPRLKGRSIDIGAAEFQDPGIREVTAFGGDNFTIFAGDEIELTASGGSRYLWNTGETTRTIKVKPPKTAIYTVKVYEYNVENTDDVIVVVRDNTNAPVNANAGNDIVICKGDNLILSAKSVPNATYLWNTGENTFSINVSPQKTQTYYVTITSGGVSDIDTVLVTVLENCQ